MYTDPIIDEIRKHRDEFSAKFDYDIKAMIEDIRRRQKESGKPTVSRNPKRVAASKFEFCTLGGQCDRVF